MYLKMKQRSTVSIPTVQEGKGLANSDHNKQGKERFCVKISSLEWIKNEGREAVWVVRYVWEPANSRIYNLYSLKLELRKFKNRTKKVLDDDKL